MKMAKTVNILTSTFLEDSFSNELQGHSLCVNCKSMDMMKLELLVKKGFKIF